MDFVSSMASKVSGATKGSAGNNNNNNNKASSGQHSEQKWADIGKDANDAFADYQTKEKEGKTPDYKEIGEVAQKAFTAYQADGDKKDLTDIGKSIAGGFMGGKKEEPKKE